jgi:hypothetical protein
LPDYDNFGQRRQPPPRRSKKPSPFAACGCRPNQAAQYNSEEHFDVIGSDTGTRYRNRHGQMMNIDQLDSSGFRVCRWCFAPEGGLAAADCMLAQKIALETFETKVLAIANRNS